MNETRTLDLSLDKIREYCQTQPIARLSELGPDFDGWLRPDTDIGYVVEYEPGAVITLLDMAGHEIDLGEILGMGVSLYTGRSLRESPFKVPFNAGRLVYEEKPGE